jgi:hypothetical protein
MKSWLGAFVTATGIFCAFLLGSVFIDILRHS